LPRPPPRPPLSSYDANATQERIETLAFETLAAVPDARVDDVGQISFVS
jgi:hypothetical protein